MPIGPEEFDSLCRKVGGVELPGFTGVRVMMMPVVIGDLDKVPAQLQMWQQTLKELFDMADPFTGQIGYLTIDEKRVKPGHSHRRMGYHVDGVHDGGVGGWGGGRGGGWGSVGTGMLTVASHIGCRAWNKVGVKGWPDKEGGCEHLANQFAPQDAIVFQPNEVYWLDGLCVHESLLQPAPVLRQFVRLSMPSEAPWFEGYTKNPHGVEPTGPVLPRRQFMDM